MDSASCCVCQKLKANLKCGLCASPVCKKCVEFVDEGSFSFFKTIPPKLSHTTYCGPCYSEFIIDEKEKYQQLIEQAKNISMFYKDQGKETRRMSRANEIFEVKDCLDREEAILRLAFFAAEKNYTTLVDVNVESKKIRQGNYQHSVWKATAVPVVLEEQKPKK